VHPVAWTEDADEFSRRSGHQGQTVKQLTPRDSPAWWGLSVGAQGVAHPPVPSVFRWRSRPAEKRWELLRPVFAGHRYQRRIAAGCRDIGGRTRPTGWLARRIDL
jgi:hypothetical protein